MKGSAWTVRTPGFERETEDQAVELTSISPSGLWEHPRGDPVVPHGAEAQAGLPRRLLQPGPLPPDRLRLDRLRRTDEEGGGF